MLQWKRIVLVLVSCIAFFASVCGQDTKIRVVDSKTGDAIPFAHVCFYGLDDQSEIYRVTNDKGFVNAELHGLNKVAISFVGYQALIDTVKAGSSKTISLSPSV